MLRIVSTKQNRINSGNATAARWESEFAYEQWCISPLDKMSAQQFEAWLVEKFGQEYLEPINYHWQGGEFLPVIELAGKSVTDCDGL